MNSVKKDVSILSSAFQINFILKLAPVLSRIAGNAVGAHFLQLYCKNEHRDPHFLSHDFDKNSASFNGKKIGKNLGSRFWQFYQIVRIELTTGRIAHIQIKSTLERKVKTGAFKGFF